MVSQFHKPVIDMNLTIVIHIYNNQEVLNIQIEHWRQWGSIPNLELIFIDDGSNPALDLSAIPKWVKKLRIIDDIPWNQPGAKNLAVSLASGSWILFLDADQFLSKDKIQQLMSQLPNFNVCSIYRFKRICSKSHRELSVHQNCQLISKDAFENFGGYDEDFSGNYGHEDAYFERLWQFMGGKIITLNLPSLVDFSNFETKGLSRNGRINELLRRRKMRYWHIKKHLIGKLILSNTIIFKFLLNQKIIADGRPTRKIRFNWKEV